jgi:hypothetical protein
VDNENTYRPIPLALISLVALFSALAALAVSGGHDAQAHGKAHGKSGISAKELALRNDMRKLWEDHVTWTRLAIISLTTDSPDTDATVGRLLRNQDDIGAAVAQFYGDAAGTRLATSASPRSWSQRRRRATRPRSPGSRPVGRRTPTRSLASSATRIRTGRSSPRGRCSTSTCG